MASRLQKRLSSSIRPTASSSPSLSRRSLPPATALLLALPAFPPTCERIECPAYDVVGEGDGYEIRVFNSTAWMLTSSIEDISFEQATLTGFLQLFDSIRGKNEYGVKLEMTAPVITQVSPSDGPFYASSFVVSCNVPKKNQGNPPPAEGLHVQKWGATYVAVRQFGGIVSERKQQPFIPVSRAPTGCLQSTKAGKQMGHRSTPWHSTIHQSERDMAKSMGN